MTLVLSLFPGIGLLDRAFEAEAFCVVRGPDLIWGGDIHRFHPPAGVFHGIIGGPPCQAFSRLANMVRLNGHETAPNLIPEFERCIAEAQPDWFVMENVPAAPAPLVDGYAIHQQLLNNRWCPDCDDFGGEQNRERLVCFGVRGEAMRPLCVQYAPLQRTEYSPAVLAAGSRRLTPVLLNAGGKPKKINKIGYSRASLKDYLRLQGVPDDFFGKHSPFTVAGMQKMLGNGVPYPMARAIARAVRDTLKSEAE